MKTVSDRPIMTYAGVVFAQASPACTHHLQAIENRFMCNATSAPWYLAALTTIWFTDSHNSKIHETGFENVLQLCSSPLQPLAVAAANYVTLREHLEHSCRTRRPKEVLNDPDDPITLATLQANHIATQTQFTRNDGQSSARMENPSVQRVLTQICFFRIAQ